MPIRWPSLAGDRGPRLKIEPNSIPPLQQRAGLQEPPVASSAKRRPITADPNPRLAHLVARALAAANGLRGHDVPGSGRLARGAAPAGRGEQAAAQTGGQLVAVRRRRLQ